jgi:hypothetical protein
MNPAFKDFWKNDTTFAIKIAMAVTKVPILTG